MPVVLRDSAEFRLPARFGLAWIRDLESGRRRALWVRPSLREKTLAAVNRRREKLDALFSESNCRALVIEDRFDADEVNRFFWT